MNIPKSPGGESAVEDAVQNAFQKLRVKICLGETESSVDVRLKACQFALGYANAKLARAEAYSAHALTQEQIEIIY